MSEQSWIWSNDGQEYFYDQHEWVRVRVEQEHWNDQSPVAPAEREAAALNRKSPYSITVCLLSLWNGLLIDRSRHRCSSRPWVQPNGGEPPVCTKYSNMLDLIWAYAVNWQEGQVISESGRYESLVTATQHFREFKAVKQKEV